MTPAQVIDDVSWPTSAVWAGLAFRPGRNGRSFHRPARSRGIWWSTRTKESREPSRTDTSSNEILMPFLRRLIISAYAIAAKAYVYIRGEHSVSATLRSRGARLRALGWQEHPGERLRPRCRDPSRGGRLHLRRRLRPAHLARRRKGLPKLKPPFRHLGTVPVPHHRQQRRDAGVCPVHPASRRRTIRRAWHTQARRHQAVLGLRHAQRPRLYEVGAWPCGSSSSAMRKVRGGRKLKAVIPGGISAKVLTADEIDVGMDFDALMAAGTMAGSGGVIVMDETACMVEALQSATKFFAHESCGQCSPCREVRLDSPDHAPYRCGRGTPSGPRRSACHRPRHGGKNDLVCSRTPQPGRSNPTLRSSGRNSRNTSGPADAPELKKL